MTKHYQEAPWWWYISVLVFSFVLGLVVVIKENITLPAWAYVVALLIGIFIAPFVSIQNDSLHIGLSNIKYRALSSILAMATALLLTICPKWWLG
jgi:hypothetical protein